jgi:hypothetical protein
LGNWLSLTTASSLLQRLLPCALPLLLWGSEERERGTDGGERKTGEDERMGILLFSPLDFGRVEMKFLLLILTIFD